MMTLQRCNANVTNRKPDRHSDLSNSIGYLYTKIKCMLDDSLGCVLS